MLSFVPVHHSLRCSERRRSARVARHRGPYGTNVRKLVMCPGKVVAAMVGDGQLGKIAMSRAGAGSWVISKPAA